MSVYLQGDMSVQTQEPPDSVNLIYTLRKCCLHVIKLINII